MMFKALTAAVLMAFASLASAQSSTDARVGTSAGGVDLTNKCVGMMGAEREKCLREQRSSGGASAGSTATSPAIGTTTPAPMTTPSTPTNPTTLPGSSTTPSGK
jgi:hypothetical protein